MRFLAVAVVLCIAIVLALAQNRREATFRNLSTRRADLHWDNGQWGSLIGTIEAGDTKTINTFDGHSFWFTAHGVGSMLTHSLTDDSDKQPARITIVADQAEYALLPLVAVQSGSCLDRFANCAKQASHEMCNSNPGWMIVNCPGSCQPHINTQGMDACALQSTEARCTHEVMGSVPTPALGAFDLDAKFEAMLTQFPELKPRVISGPAGHPLVVGHCNEHQQCSAIPDGPWIIGFDEFALEEEIEALLVEAEGLGFSRSTEQGAMTESGEQEKTLSTARTSKNTWCTGQCEDNPVVSQLQRRIAAVTGTPKHNAESLQVLSYSTGQYYRPHQDDSGGKQDLAGPRIMTLFMYLSDVEEGGETHFPRVQGGLLVKPKKGSAIVWGNMLHQDVNKDDPRTLHEAKPVIKGRKLAANAWIHNDNYALPNKWGCTGSFS